MYSDTPALGSGATRAQLFVGLNTHVTDVYPLQTEKQFVNTLEDNIRYRGAMSKMISDSAQVEISGRAKELLRVLSIPQWSSEPYSQWQNPAERRIQYIKQVANTVMDMQQAPPETWLHCLMYVAFVINHLWDESIGAVPLTALTGILLTSVSSSVLASGNVFTLPLLNPNFPPIPVRLLVTFWALLNMLVMPCVT